MLKDRRTSTLKNLKNFIHRQLEPIAHENGEVMYSPTATLKAGPVYLLGFNPGYVEALICPIAEHIDYSFSRTNHSYLDEDWGSVTLQNRVCGLLKQAGWNPRDVPASNLIFKTSTTAAEIETRFGELSEICWPVHLAIMDIVKPSKLVVIGNGDSKTAWSYIKNKYDCHIDKPLPSYGTFSLKRLHTEIDGRKVTVVGLPHLSRFSPDVHFPNLGAWMFGDWSERY